MSEYGLLSIVPPVLAIALAIRTKQVIFSLITGIFVGWCIIYDGNIFSAFLGTIQSMVDVMKSDGNTRTIIFTLLIGALIQLIRVAGGMDGFIGLIQHKLNSTKRPKSRLQMAAGLTGFLVFIESNSSNRQYGNIGFNKYQESCQDFRWRLA